MLWYTTWYYFVLPGAWRGEDTMATATAHDVAAYILQRAGQMTAMKLQKLVYYCQAWSLVWDARPLFNERIEAWVSGPVIPDLYSLHRGQFMISEWPRGNPGRLDATAQETVNAVVEYYAGHTAQWLSDLTHAEDPWRHAREGIPEGERGDREITPAALEEYYSALSARA